MYSEENILNTLKVITVFVTLIKLDLKLGFVFMTIIESPICSVLERELVSRPNRQTSRTT